MRRSIVPLVVATLVAVPAVPAHASFPGKNGRIAFRRVLSSGSAAIFTVEPDGTGERQLTHPRGGDWTTTPSWSPDGRWIVFMRWPGGDADRANIWKMRANGTDRVRLDGSCTAPCLSDGFPTWSPDGDRIAFGRSLGPATGQNNVNAIVTASADGTDVQQVTQVGADPTIEQPYADVDPSWSPDGERLAFERIRGSTEHHAIFTIRQDGTGLRRLTPWDLDAASPDWSPDGRWIVLRTQETSPTHGDLGLVHPNGDRLHLITSGPGKWGICSFSPDGRSLTAAWNIALGGPDLYTMTLHGIVLQSLMRTKKNEGAPSWGPRPR
jgi:Tol biopolymer transport system component